MPVILDAIDFASAILDGIDFPDNDPVNTALITTGLTPLAVGSVETFQLSATLNGLPWNLAGGTVTLTLQDPNGLQTVLTATAAGYTATANWTVTNVPGNWTRCWTVTDASGNKQVSRPITFSVTTSP